MPIVRAANGRLQDHQRIRAASVWTTGELPRTEGTRKLKRASLRDWVRSASSPPRPASGDTLESLIARFAHGRDVSGATTLEELGLSSLERVELMIALEDRFQTRLDEGRFAEAASVADLKQLVEHAPSIGGGRGAGRLSLVEPHVAGARHPAAVAGHLDPAARARVRAGCASKDASICRISTVR